MTDENDMSKPISESLKTLGYVICSQTRRLEETASIALLEWFKRLKLWQISYICKTNVPGLCDYARALFNVQVENLDSASEQQIDLYNTLCETLKKLYGFGILGAPEIPKSI